MALKPLLKAKVDELFLRWLSEPETQNILRTSLSQVSGQSALEEVNKLYCPLYFFPTKAFFSLFFFIHSSLSSIFFSCLPLN